MVFLSSRGPVVDKYFEVYLCTTSLRYYKSKILIIISNKQFITKYFTFMFKSIPKIILLQKKELNMMKRKKINKKILILTTWIM